jgi:dethiobiotin synthase
MASGVFVTGTDTGIGKTRTSAALALALNHHALNPGYYKPIQTGEDDDCAWVAQNSGLRADQIAQPTCRYALPAAPWRAAQAEGKEVELEVVRVAWDALPQPRSWIVEGAGGLLVPINETETIADLVWELELPFLLVASTRLGTINHTLLSLESARTRGLRCLGIILNGPDDPGLKECLETHGRTPVVAQLPWREADSPQLLREDALRAFPIELLQKLWSFKDTV